MAGIKLTHVPYRGTAPALTDLIGGHVQMFFSSLPPAVAIAKEGKVRALAVTGAARSAVFPDLPTVAEAACRASRRCCITASSRRPARRDADHRQAQRGAARGGRSPETEDAHGRRRHRPLPSTPEEYAADIDKEEKKWSAIVRASGAKAQSDASSPACGERVASEASRGEGESQGVASGRSPPHPASFAMLGSRPLPASGER